VCGVVAWLARKPLGKCVAICRAHYNRPEAVAVRKLRAACTADDAPAAYAALLGWFAAQRTRQKDFTADSFLESKPQHELRSRFQDLSRTLFGADDSSIASWRGQPLWKAFSQSLKALRSRHSQTSSFALPEMNPTAPVD
jgi:hypothetical protein